jgi:hypothetical protein
MPNELGLYTKAEAKNIRDYAYTQGWSKIYEIAQIIKGWQASGEVIELTFNEVVPVQVAAYFKAQPLGYAVTDSTQGQPQGMTRLSRISWA